MKWKETKLQQACCLAQLCLAAAQFLFIPCGPSYVRRLYVLATCPNFHLRRVLGRILGISIGLHQAKNAAENPSENHSEFRQSNRIGLQVDDFLRQTASVFQAQDDFRDRFVCFKSLLHFKHFVSTLFCFKSLQKPLVYKDWQGRSCLRDQQCCLEKFDITRVMSCILHKPDIWYVGIQAESITGLWCLQECMRGAQITRQDRVSPSKARTRGEPLQTCGMLLTKFQIMEPSIIFNFFHKLLLWRDFQPCTASHHIELALVALFDGPEQLCGSNLRPLFNFLTCTSPVL